MIVQWVITHDDPDGKLPFHYISFKETEDWFFIEGKQPFDNATIVSNKLKKEFEDDGALFQALDTEGIKNPQWKEVGVFRDIIESMTISVADKISPEDLERFENELASASGMGIPSHLLKPVVHIHTPRRELYPIEHVQNHIDSKGQVEK
jgi:hypothetical protein